MAKLKFGEGISLEAQLPEKAKVSPENEVETFIGISIDDIVDAVTEMLPPTDTQLNDVVNVLDSRVTEIVKEVTKDKELIVQHRDEIERELSNVSHVLDDIHARLPDEKTRTATESDHIEESLASLSNRLVAKDVHITEVEAKLISRIEKQKAINLAFGVGIIVSILINLI